MGNAKHERKRGVHVRMLNAEEAKEKKERKKERKEKGLLMEKDP